MEIAGRREPGMLLRLGQRAFEQAARRRRLPPRQPHARQRHGGAERIGHVTGRPHAADRLRERLDRGLQIPRAEQRQSQEPGAADAGEMIVRARPARAPGGHARRCRPRRRELGRPTPGRPPSSLGAARSPARVRRPRRRSSTPSRSPSTNRDPRRERAQDRPAADDLVGQGFEPAAERADPAAAGAPRAGPARSGRRPARRRRPRARGRWHPRGVRGRAYHRLAAVCRSATRSRLLGGRASAQGVGEQVVIAVPAPLVVERDDEQVVCAPGSRASPARRSSP